MIENQELKEFIESTYLNLLENQEGEVADYIPQLKKVNPELFGISACLLDGTIISKGDTDKQFCLQSCAKPLT